MALGLPVELAMTTVLAFYLWLGSLTLVRDTDLRSLTLVVYYFQMLS
jgi:hypothetical protein